MHEKAGLFDELPERQTEALWRQMTMDKVLDAYLWSWIDTVSAALKAKAMEDGDAGTS